MGQKVDAHAELANPVCLLENLDLDALLVQAERRAEAADAATDDERLHRILPCMRPAAGRRLLLISDYAASLKSPICASNARLKAGRAVQRSI